MLQGIAFGIVNYMDFHCFGPLGSQKSAQIRIFASTFLPASHILLPQVFIKFITFLISPLLSAEAPDATGPCGHFPSPGRRVSCLSGPELGRPMLLLQLQPSTMVVPIYCQAEIFNRKESNSKVLFLSRPSR